MARFNLYGNILDSMEKDRRFQYEKELQEKRDAENLRRFNLAQERQNKLDAENQRRFNLAQERQKAADARAAEIHDFNQKINTAKLAELDRAKQLRDYSQRGYDSYAEGLGSVRAGVPIEKLPEDQQQALFAEFRKGIVGDENAKAQDYSTEIAAWARDTDVSGSDDQFQKFRNAEYRKTLADREAAALKNKDKGIYNKEANAALFTAAANRMRTKNPQIFKDVDMNNTFAAARAYYEQRRKDGKPVSEENALRYALGDSATTIGGNEIFLSDMKTLYGKQFDNLDDTEKRDLVNLTQDFSRQLADINAMRKNGKLDDTQYLYALRELDKTWTNKDFASPVRDEIHELEYAELLKELDAKEKAISAKHPRRYKWVKDNQDASIGGWKMKRNLAPSDAEIKATGKRFLTPEAVEAARDTLDGYGDFIRDLNKLQDIRNALTDRERWIAQNANKRNVGK